MAPTLAKDDDNNTAVDTTDTADDVLPKRKRTASKKLAAQLDEAKKGNAIGATTYGVGDTGKNEPSATATKTKATLSHHGFVQQAQKTKQQIYFFSSYSPFSQ